MAGILVQNKLDQIRVGFKPSSTISFNQGSKAAPSQVTQSPSNAVNRIFNVRKTMVSNQGAQQTVARTGSPFDLIPRDTVAQNKGLSKYDDPKAEENFFQKLFNPLQDKMGDTLNKAIEESSATQWFDQLMKANPGSEQKLTAWVSNGVYNNDWTLDGKVPTIVDPDSGQTVTIADYVNTNPAFRTTLGLTLKKRSGQTINLSFDILEPSIQSAYGSPVAGTARSVLELVGQKNSDLYKTLSSPAAYDIDKGIGQFTNPLTLNTSKRSQFYKGYRDPESTTGKVVGGLSEAAGTLVGMAAIAPATAPAGQGVANIASKSPFASQFLQRIAPGATNAFIVGAAQDPGGEGIGGFLDPMSRIKQGATGAATYAIATGVGGVTGKALEGSKLPQWAVRGTQGVAGGGFDVARSYAMGERDPAKLATGFGLGFAYGARTGQDDINAIFGKDPRGVIDQVKSNIKGKTIEDIVEEAGGWKTKGDKQAFDEALFMKDSAKVQELLPTVPEEYRTRFNNEINALVGDGNTVKLYRGDSSQESPGRFLTNDPELAKLYGDTTEYSVMKSKILDVTTPEGKQYVIDNFGQDTLAKLRTEGGRLPDGGNPETVKLLANISDKAKSDFDLIKTREYFEGDGMPESYFSTKDVSKQFGEPSPFTKEETQSAGVKQFLKEHPDMDPNAAPKDYEWSKWDELMSQVQNRAKAIEDLSPEARNDVRKVYGAPGQAKARVLEELAPVFKENGITVDELSDVEIDDAAKRNLNLAEGGQKGATEIMYPKDGVFGKNSTAKIPETIPDNPRYESAFNKLQEYNKTMLDYVYQGGLLSDEGYKALSEYGDYVPFQRYMEDEFKSQFTKSPQVGSVSSQDLIKKYTGSDKPILSPIESTITNTVRAEQLVNRNNLAKTIVSELGDMVQEVDNTKGLDPNQYISLFEGGEKKFYQAPEPIVEAAKNLNNEQMSMYVKILAAPATVLRQGATSANLNFMLPNILRDQFNAAINSQYGYRPFADYASGFKSLLTKDQSYVDYLKSGAEINFGLNNKEMIDAITPKGEESGFVSKIKEFAHPIKALQTLAEYSEVPTRIGLYKRAITSGATPDQAMFESRNATADFNVRGSKTQSVTAIIPFLNARVQGIDSTMRTLKADPKAGLAKIGLYAVLPTVITTAMLESTPVANQISDYDKDKYWIIPLKGAASTGPDDFFKIAKPQVAYLLNPFRKAFEMQQQGKNVDPVAFFADLADEASPISLIQSDTKTGQFRVDPNDIIPMAFKPPLEIMTNYDFYRQRPILSEKQKSLPGPYQYNSKTSPLFKDLGNLTGQSPAALQQLTYGYTGGLGQSVSDIVGKVAGSEQRYPKQERPGSPSAAETPIVSRFLGVDLYTQGEQVDTWQYQLSELRKRMQTIKSSRTMSASQKKYYLNDLSQQVKELQANKPD